MSPYGTLSIPPTCTEGEVLHTNAKKTQNTNSYIWNLNAGNLLGQKRDIMKRIVHSQQGSDEHTWWIHMVSYSTSENCFTWIRSIWRERGILIHLSATDSNSHTKRNDSTFIQIRDILQRHVSLATVHLTQFTVLQSIHLPNACLSCSHVIMTAKGKQLHLMSLFEDAHYVRIMFDQCHPPFAARWFKKSAGQCC